jgi:dephospho-CoA kinase
MSLIYITGVPGAGKSTVRQELLRRGYTVYGGAEDNIAAFYNNETGERLEGWVEAKDRTPEWKARYTWKIMRETVERLKQQAKNEIIFLCAVTRNDVDELWDLFDIVIALTIDGQTLRYRLGTRTNNDVGKTQDELQSIIKRQKAAEESYRRLGAAIIDGRSSINKVVDEIVALSKKTIE